MAHEDLLHSMPHRRQNPLTGEWVLVSPQRLSRPWLGRVDRSASVVRPAYDAACYLCPGNLRAGGDRNPAYERTFVFSNDYPVFWFRFCHFISIDPTEKLIGKAFRWNMAIAGK